MTALGYYPGCSLSGAAREYDLSLRAIAARLETELREIPDWVCCGATSAHAIDHNAAFCLAADALLKAHRAGLQQVLAPCAMCFSRLATATQELRRNSSLARQVALSLGGEAPRLAQVQAINLLTWLEGFPAGVLEKHVVRPLKGLKVACYYGCLLLRPPRVTGAVQVEVPRKMEAIVARLGAQGVRWSMATECCGAGFSLTDKTVVLRQGRRIYGAARAAGADLMVLACPMCHSNLDMRQSEFAAGEAPLPVLYLTQLIGLAWGLSREELGLRGHFVPVEPEFSAALARG